MNGDIRDIKPIFEFASPWPYYLIAVLLVILLSYCIYRLILKIKFKKRTVPLVNMISPKEQLLATIARLEVVDSHKESCFELSEALRLYIEHSYHIATTDLTFEEISELKLPISVMARNTCLHILKRTDLVKFAEIEITNYEMKELLKLAREFVDATL